MDADFPWLAYGWRLLQGTGVTLAISLAAMLVSLAGGVLLGVLMTLPNRLLRFICRAYLEFIRFMPVLVLLYICYFGFAAWFGWHWQAYSVCILVFSLWGIAEMGDLVRGALESIEKHQVESAKALGLNRRQVFWYIELPQSVQRALPGAINLFTRMVKTSSLAALIGVVEVVKVGQQIIENSLLTMPNASFWVYGLIFILYFLCCWPLSLLAGYLEKKWES